MEMEKQIGIAEQGDGFRDGSSGKVCANDDLLIEILVRLPVKSVVLFKSVSKRWLSLIADRSFRWLFCTQNPNPNPPSGLFLQRLHSPEYDLVPWDTGNPLTKPPFTTLDIDFDAGGAIRILRSCSNGLLLCHRGFGKFYVYNPVINLVKILPPFNDWKSRSFGGMIIALDPSESSHDHYRVVCVRTLQVEGTNKELYQVETYYSCSETGSGQWMVSGSSEPYDNGTVPWDFSDRVYCNDTVHWLQAYKETLYFKFSEKTIRCMDGPVHQEEEEDNDAVVESSDSNIVESHGKILLVVSCILSEKHRVYEWNNDHSGWSSKYCVNVDPVSRRMDLTGKKYLFADHTLLVVGGNK